MNLSRCAVREIVHIYSQYPPLTNVQHHDDSWLSVRMGPRGIPIWGLAKLSLLAECTSGEPTPDVDATVKAALATVGYNAKL